MEGFSLNKYRSVIAQSDLFEYSGRISQIIGLTVEANGPIAKIGDLCRIYTNKDDGYISAEIVGFRDKKVLLMPFGPLSGVGPGNRVVSTSKTLMVGVGPELKGRVLDGLGNVMDNKGPLVTSGGEYPIENDPPNPLTRRRIHDILPLGIRAIDGLLTVGSGQRVGIFAGSGVGKSTLLGMIARNAQADVNVITLIGERGREVNDFIEKDLQEEGLKKSVLVIATSDQPALIRVKCAMVGTAVAEYFRDQGLRVLLMMDSLTRFSMAQREVGMATGEPPVSRGYTPSVYSTLPRLLERSGSSDKGSITGLYTVLVEGDDMNEPIADTVRGILDGHIVLNRRLAQQNHYPAIDVLQSISRLMSDISSKEQKAAAGFVKNMMATYGEAQDLINIGAYQNGSNPTIDEAIRLHEPITAFLQQEVGQKFTFEDTLGKLDAIYSARKQ